MKDVSGTRMARFLREGNDAVDAAFDRDSGLRKSIHSELLALMPDDEGPAGYVLDGWWYRLRFRKGADHPVFVRRRARAEGPEETLLDIDAMAQGRPFFACEGLRVSPGGRLLAFAVDTTGDREFTIRFMNLETRELLEDSIPGADSNTAWAADERALFYSGLEDGTLRPFRVKRHGIGSDNASDRVVYEEADERFRCLLIESRSREFVFLNCFSDLSEETLVMRSDDQSGDFAVFCPRSQRHVYDLDHDSKRFVVRSNREHPDFRVYDACSLGQEADEWREVAGPDARGFIENIAAFRDFVAMTGFMDGSKRLWVVDRRAAACHEVALPDTVCHVWLDANPSVDTCCARVGYTSLRTPVTYYDLDMRSLEMTEVRRECIPGYRPDEYLTERVWAAADDGARIPISVVRRKDALDRGPAPLLIFAYGAYGTNIPTYFDQSRLCLLDRGFVYAMAHVRGGSELGARWHEQGRLLSKANSITDFIACTEHLASTGVARRGSMFAESLSAGGIVLGAAANMRPDLFRGMCLMMPFVDPAGTLSDPSLPLSCFEWDELGDPNDPGQREYIRSYSPYDNVKDQAYPDMLVFAARNDSQVPCWEPARWVARLREHDTGGARILLQTALNAGHSGLSGRMQRLGTLALQYAFYLDCLGMD